MLNKELEPKPDSESEATGTGQAGQPDQATLATAARELHEARVARVDRPHKIIDFTAALKYGKNQLIYIGINSGGCLVVTTNEDNLTEAELKTLRHDASQVAFDTVPAQTIEVGTVIGDFTVKRRPHNGTQESDEILIQFNFQPAITDECATPESKTITLAWSQLWPWLLQNLSTIEILVTDSTDFRSLYGLTLPDPQKPGTAYALIFPETSAHDSLSQAHAVLGDLVRELARRDGKFKGTVAAMALRDGNSRLRAVAQDLRALQAMALREGLDYKTDIDKRKIRPAPADSLTRALFHLSLIFYGPEGIVDNQRFHDLFEAYQKGSNPPAAQQDKVEAAPEKPKLRQGVSARLSFVDILNDLQPPEEIPIEFSNLVSLDLLTHDGSAEFYAWCRDQEIKIREIKISSAEPEELVDILGNLVSIFGLMRIKGDATGTRRGYDIYSQALTTLSSLIGQVGEQLPLVFAETAIREIGFSETRETALVRFLVNFTLKLAEKKQPNQIGVAKNVVIALAALGLTRAKSGDTVRASFIRSQLMRLQRALPSEITMMTKMDLRLREEPDYHQYGIARWWAQSLELQCEYFNTAIAGVLSAIDIAIRRRRKR